MNVVKLSYGAITDVKDNRTKSLLRGLLNREIDEGTYSTYDNLRVETSAEDIENVSRLLLSSPLFAHLNFVEDFPNTPHVALRARELSNQSLYNEIVFQGVRISNCAEKLASALADLQTVNDHLLEERGEAAVNALTDFVERYGYSLLVLSKLAYARAIFHDQKTVVTYCDAELHKYDVHRRNAIALAAVDMMGDLYEFLPLRKNLLDFATSKAIRAHTRDILHWQFRPIRFLRNDLASQLQSQGLTSLIDVFLFLAIHRYSVNVFSQLGVDILVDKYIPQSLRDAWNKLSAGECPSKRMKFKSSQPEFNDYTFYRRSLAWIEYKNIAVFRNGVDPLYVENTAKDHITNDPAIDYLENYFEGVRSLESLAGRANDYRLSLEKYDNEHAGVFLRTIAFSYFLRSGSKGADISPHQLLCLLNQTRDIPRIATVDELRTFFLNQQSDLLASYLANALIADCSKLNIDQHRVRRALQTLIIKRFNADIVEFANYLAQQSKHVAINLFERCTEAFLVQLFFLLPRPEMVFEARARLLDWYADVFNEPIARERARTLRLDQRLRAVRGEIDDTRIYVDPLRFGQWLEDNALDELNAILRENAFEDGVFNSFADFGDFAAQRQPHVRLAICLQAAFQEFCSNKRYGADSYLGRRIRHGTLKGVMVGQLQTILEKPKYEPLMASNSAKRFITSWLQHYETRIDYWGQEVFQVRNKQKPKGAIVPDITSGEKLDAARAALKDIANVFVETKSLQAVLQNIMEWCWRLIEKDLTSIRMTIDTGRTHWGVISRVDLQSLCSDELLNLAGELCREINSLTDERFRQLARWFTKPTNLAPSTSLSLLLDAVLDEVKGHFPTYNPIMKREGLSDIELVGMYYHHVYDFLYVVIYNAAKHGDRQGPLGQAIELSDGLNSMRRLKIIISSRIAKGASIDKVRSDIDAAMSGSIEDAMVVEGRSGLKKLLRLSADVREIKSIKVSYTENVISFHCVMILAKA